MNLEHVGSPIGLIVDDRTKNNLLLSVEPKKENVMNSLPEIKLPHHQHFQLIPNINNERDIHYITGASGSGKSFFAKKYIDQYRKLHPKREIYLFSSLKEDSSIDKVKNLRRIQLNPDFLNEDLTAEDFKDSLVIFDDTDCITDKKMRLKVQAILNNLLESGRHHRVSVIYTSHTPCNGNDTKKILNEAHSITVFPHGLGGRGLKYLLEQYLGLDKHQIKKMKNLDSRAVSVLKTYPQICLAEREAFVVTSKE
jgi:hypothetical protein